MRELKSWPVPFEGVLQGKKRFEIRLEDGEKFEPLELIRLREFVPGGPEPDGFFRVMTDGKIDFVACLEVQRTIPRRGAYPATKIPGSYSGREVVVRVTWIERNAWGLPPGLVVLGIENVGEDWSRELAKRIVDLMVESALEQFPTRS